MHEANVGVIRGAEERGNECVAVILIHWLLLCFVARYTEEYEESERAVVILFIRQIYGKSSTSLSSVEEGSK